MDSNKQCCRLIYIRDIRDVFIYIRPMTLVKVERIEVCSGSDKHFNGSKYVPSNVSLKTSGEIC